MSRKKKNIFHVCDMICRVSFEVKRWRERHDSFSDLLWNLTSFQIIFIMILKKGMGTFQGFFSTRYVCVMSQSSLVSLVKLFCITNWQVRNLFTLFSFPILIANTAFSNMASSNKPWEGFMTLDKAQAEEVKKMTPEQLWNMQIC